MTQQSAGERLSGLPVLAALLGTALLASLPSVLPKPGQPVGVVFAPWLDHRDIFARVVNAGGSVIGFGDVSGMVIASGDQDDFYLRLRMQGAALVLDGSMSGRLCGVVPLNKQEPRWTDS